MDTLMTEAFSGLDIFLRANDKAFQDILYEFDKSAIFLAEYNNYLMITGLKGKDSQAEVLIEEVFTLFKLLKDKDAFIKKNRGLYAQRLLNHTSISDISEDSLISKLKVELGAQHVAQYQQMTGDLKNSGDMLVKFKTKHADAAKNWVFAVKVLTTGLWGVQKKAPCKLPEELSYCLGKFEDFYVKEHTGRYVELVANLGECELITHYLPASYTFITSVYQASILSLFNTQDTYTYNEIKDITKFTDDELKTQMYNICCPSLGRILLKENGKTPKFSPEEKLTLNKGYNHKSLRPMLNPTAPPDPEENKIIAIRELAKERAVIIQATIIKIMKGRRQEIHNTLINETLKQIQTFKPEGPVIKQQIEDLITADYLMRNPEDTKQYIYKP
jgi:hypothetical protein